MVQKSPKERQTTSSGIRRCLPDTWGMASMPHEAILTVRDLSVSYAGSVALSAASLTACAEELICVVAAKTSLIRAIAGIAQPSDGTICWRGDDITGMSPWEICELGIAQVAEGR